MAVWKGGNRQIRGLELQLFYNDFDNQIDDNWDPYVLPLPVDAKRAVQKLNKMLLKLNKDEPPPCIYTAIRDPISHFLLGYNELQFRHTKLYPEMPKIFPKYVNGYPPLDLMLAPYHYRIPFLYNKGFIAEDGKSGMDLDEESYHNRLKERFIEFVKDVLMEEINIARNLEYTHIFPMTSLLTKLERHGLKLTGYIPQLSNLVEDWASFISGTCPGTPSIKYVPTLNINCVHPSSADEFGFYEAAKEVWKEGGTVARALCLLHVLDYACWTNLPEGIPKLCLDVYCNHSEAILKTIHA